MAEKQTTGGFIGPKSAKTIKLPKTCRDAQAAALALETYGRFARAALEVGGGRPAPPVLRLSDEQLRGLFSPSQILLLVRPSDA